MFSLPTNLEGTLQWEIQAKNKTKQKTKYIFSTNTYFIYYSTELYYTTKYGVI